MMYVYRIHIYIVARDANQSASVHKDIIRYRVVKTGRDHFHINPWPVTYGDIGSIRVEKSECFTELEDAKKVAADKANKLIKNLEECIDTLAHDAKVLDKTQEINAEAVVDCLRDQQRNPG